MEASLPLLTVRPRIPRGYALAVVPAAPTPSAELSVEFPDNELAIKSTDLNSPPIITSIVVVGIDENRLPVPIPPMEVSSGDAGVLLYRYLPLGARVRIRGVTLLGQENEFLVQVVAPRTIVQWPPN